MDVSLITFLMFALLVILLITGLPLTFVLGGVAAISSIAFCGTSGLSMLSSICYGVMNNFLLTSIPLFIFMGMVLQHSGIATALYEMIYGWVGGLRGGLAAGTILVCAVFAAMCGVSAAATVTMGVIALPSMLQHNYHKQIAVGCVSAGGSLGVLIPPSILMILYGVFADESIGSLFAAGVVPGVLLAALFMIYILIRCRFQPKMGPAVANDERPSWKVRIRMLRSVVLPMGLIGLVLGSIFFGAATPTEAAALGSLGALICAAISGNLSWRIFKTASMETSRVSIMICWIIIGGSCFTSVYNSMGAVDFIKGFVNALPVSPYVVLISMQLLLIILGMLIDPGGIIMICTPVFVPIIKSLGFDPVWFGVLFIINMEMGYLTPPFGFNLFYMKGIAPPSVSMVDIYKSVIPFVLIQIFFMAVIIIFPELALWLPRLLIK